MAQPDQIDIQIGIYEGLELTNDEIAEAIGRSREAIRLRRTGAKKNFIDMVSAWVQGAAAKKLAVKIAAAESKARINAKAYKVTEKALDNGLEEGKDVAAIHLEAAKLGLDRTEGKALDRKAILTANAGDFDNGNSIADDDLNEILDEARRMIQIRKQALLPEAEEAETVELSGPTN